MRILVDGDACPVKEIIIRVAKAYGIPVDMYIDSSHYFQDDYCRTIIIGKGKDAVDFALISRAARGDLIITGDYGVATMALSKGAYCIHPNGFIYSNDNMDRLLMERHLSAKARKAKKSYTKMKKRSVEQDRLFEQKLIGLLENHKN
ncbi:YaiI/YqxD family protein [Vallitalea pronyensis]|uniref:UPF0178 protein HZI73_00160 n=1 Tax=Vallitalea pronyensis TaxID=1348613 RepID=A0A8J8SEW9_9FIRM|nr:YaiI/YqxD family protein [Vallitalea pronyensis]QUI20817.1 YaiI/YqxD family protein [Vallitalea pronyensis]